MKSKHRTKAQKMHAQVQRQKAAVEQQYSYRASNTRGAEVKMSPSVPVARSFSSISPATSLSTAPTMPADKKDYAHQLFAYDWTFGKMTIRLTQKWMQKADMLRAWKRGIMQEISWISSPHLPAKMYASDT